MDYVYYTEEPDKKEDVKLAIAAILEKSNNFVIKSDRYRKLAEYPEFPEVSKYPFDGGDRVFFVGICHPKKWLNHWCAKGIEIVVFCNDSQQFPLSREHQWNGRLKMHLSEKRTLVEMYQYHMSQGHTSR